MNYLFLVYSAAQWESLPVKDKDLFAEACQANIEELEESGYLLANVDLQSDTAVTVRVKQGIVLLSDDPPLATEALVRLFVIEARDLNEAVQLASRMPQINYGPISIWLPSVWY